MKPYNRPPPHRFWISRMPYFMFIVREMTSLFTAGFCLFLLYFIYTLGQGPEAFNGFIEGLSSNIVISVHWVVLIFALYHTYTWFALTPKVMVIWIGEKKLPVGVVLTAVYGGWLAVSVALFLLITGYK